MRYLALLALVLPLVGCGKPNRSPVRTERAEPLDPRRGPGPTRPAPASVGGVAAAFSPDGKRLLTTFTKDNQRPGDPPPERLPAEWKLVTLWEVATGKVVRTFPEAYRGERQHQLAFLPDGKHALSAAQGRWRVFAVPGGEVIREVDTKPWKLIPWDLSRDGKRLLTSGLPTLLREVQLWDVESGKMLVTTDTNPGISGAWLSPDGKLALLDGGQSDQGRRTPMRLWDFARRKPVVALPEGEGEWWGSPAAFSPDGKTFVASLADRSHLRMFHWDVQTGKKVRQIGDTWNYPNWAQAAAFSADGKHLVVATSNWQVPAGNRLERYPVAGGKPVWSVPIPPGTHTALFSRDGDLALLASGEMNDRFGKRMRLTLWDTARGEELRELQQSP